MIETHVTAKMSFLTGAMCLSGRASISPGASRLKFWRRLRAIARDDRWRTKLRSHPAWFTQKPKTRDMLFRVSGEPKCIRPKYRATFQVFHTYWCRASRRSDRNRWHQLTGLKRLIAHDCLNGRKNDVFWLQPSPPLCQKTQWKYVLTLESSRKERIHTVEFLERRRSHRSRLE